MASCPPSVGRRHGSASRSHRPSPSACVAISTPCTGGGLLAGQPPRGSDAAPAGGGGAGREHELDPRTVPSPRTRASPLHTVKRTNGDCYTRRRPPPPARSARRCPTPVPLTPSTTAGDCLCVIPTGYSSSSDCALNGPPTNGFDCGTFMCM